MDLLISEIGSLGNKILIMKKLLFIFVLFLFFGCKKEEVISKKKIVFKREKKITKTKDWIYTEEKQPDGTIIYTEERVQEKDTINYSKIKFPFNKIKKIEFLSYPNRMFWDNRNDRQAVEYGELVINQKIVFDTTLIKERISLNQIQTKELYLLLKNKCNVQEPIAGCYNPRNMILYRDFKNKIIAYQEFCFECIGSRESKNLLNNSSFCLLDMKQLFKKVGIKYFNDSDFEKK